MLNEHFVASVGASEAPVTTSVSKDCGIFVQEFQPIAGQKVAFKKSTTARNCLAVSESHIFAAQAGKGLVHVYNRTASNQEATVPFTERITCLALACADTVLVLGTADGRIFLWEICSGRQIATEQAHLQQVTVLTVDPTSNFLLSASADSTIHIWSIPALLSFSRPAGQPLSPLRTLNSHRAEISALVLGHSSSSYNFAVSISKDRTCIVWDYYEMKTLRTYLLPAVATCVALDAADRFACVGYEDGGIQMLDLLAGQAGRPDSILNAHDALAPVQPPKSTIIRCADTSNGAVLSMDLSFDSCTILTGHQAGTVLSWDAARGRYQSGVLQAPLPGPVTNLQFLPVIGLPDIYRKSFRVASVIKPKFGAFDTSSGDVPSNYSISIELLDDFHHGEKSTFEEALTAPSFPTELIDESLAEIATWNRTGKGVANATEFHENDDFMALENADAPFHEHSLEEENKTLKSELEALRRVQQASFDKIEKMAAEKRELLKREKALTSRLDNRSSTHTGAPADNGFAINGDTESSDEGR